MLGTEKLVRYSLLAGERALAAFAYERALGHFQRALAAKEGQPVDAETAALLVGLGRSQMALLDDEAYSTLRRAVDYYADSGDLEQVVAIAEFPDYGAARRIGLGQLVARALPLAPADSLQSGWLLSRYGQFIGLQDAAFDEALDALNQAIVISRREGDEALELQSLVALASVYSNHMRYDETLDSGLQAIELTKRVPDPRSEVSALYFVVTCLIEKGELEAAKRHASEMLPPAEQLRDRFWLEGAFGKNAMTLRLAGEWEMARSFSQRTLEIGSRPFHSWVELALIEHETGDHHQGNLHLNLLSKASDEARESAFMNTSVSGRMALIAPLVGRITGVVGHLESAKNAAERVLGYAQATPLAAGYSNAGLAMIAVLSGDADLAGKQYAAIKPWRHTFSLFVISADRLLGLLAQIMGKLDQAIIHFDDALIFCRKGGYRPELAWTCCDYADVLRVRDTEGDCAKAIALLDESLAISSNLGMRPLMERVLARKLELQSVASVDIRTSIDAVASAVSIERPDLRHHSAPDGTVTILFGDIEGFTPMTERLGDQRAQQVLREHNAIVRHQVAAHRGFEVKSLGDGFMLAFSSARRALQCSIAIQQAFAAHNREHPDGLVMVRIGMHTGEFVREMEDFFGKNVILASRIADQARGGEILVSALLKELTESAGDIRFGQEREVELKGLAGVNRVHAVDWN